MAREAVVVPITATPLGRRAAARSPRGRSGPNNKNCCAYGVTISIELPRWRALRSDDSLLALAGELEDEGKKCDRVGAGVAWLHPCQSRDWYKYGSEKQYKFRLTSPSCPPCAQQLGYLLLISCHRESYF